MNAAVRAYGVEAGLGQDEWAGFRSTFNFGNGPQDDAAGADGEAEAEQAQADNDGPEGDEWGQAGSEQTRTHPAWGDPLGRLLRAELPKPPALPLHEVFGPKAAEWIGATAEASGAPADYVVAALFSSTGGVMGNARWVSPWKGWVEPPLIWSMCVGLPSAGKSPAIDAVLSGARRAEKPMRIAIAKDKGVYQGRKPPIDRDAVTNMLTAGSSITSVARALGISRQSVYRIRDEVGI